MHSWIILLSLAICLILIFIISLVKVNVGTTNIVLFFEVVEKLIE